MWVPGKGGRMQNTKGRYKVSLKREGGKEAETMDAFSDHRQKPSLGAAHAKKKEDSQTSNGGGKGGDDSQELKDELRQSLGQSSQEERKKKNTGKKSPSTFRRPRTKGIGENNHLHYEEGPKRWGEHGCAHLGDRGKRGDRQMKGQGPDVECDGQK